MQTESLDRTRYAAQAPCMLGGFHLAQVGDRCIGLRRLHGKLHAEPTNEPRRIEVMPRYDAWNPSFLARRRMNDLYSDLLSDRRRLAVDRHENPRQTQVSGSPLKFTAPRHSNSSAHLSHQSRSVTVSCPSV